MRHLVHADVIRRQFNCSINWI